MTCIEDSKNKNHGLIMQDEINDLISASVNFSLFCHQPESNNNIVQETNEKN